MRRAITRRDFLNGVAYTDAAIDQAHRAVGELLRLTAAPATGEQP